MQTCPQGAAQAEVHLGLPSSGRRWAFVDPTTKSWTSLTRLTSWDHLLQICHPMDGDPWHVLNRLEEKLADVLFVLPDRPAKDQLIVA